MSNKSLPSLPPKFNFDQVAILKQLNKANIALAKLNATARFGLLPDPLLLIAPLLARESVASSGIENINTTVEQVFQMELLPEKKRTGAAKEVLHYRDAMLEGFKIVQKKELLTTNDIVKLQKIVEPTKSGIRKLPVSIKKEKTGEIIYEPPKGEKVLRDLLQNLEKYMHSEKDETDALLKVSVIHHQFECIHPFLDGNGRVGRIIMILYLVLSKRIDYPILFLSGYIEKNKGDYYSLLRVTSETGDYTELLMYFLQGIEEQANNGVERLEKIQKLMANFRKKVPSTIKVQHQELAECVFSRPLLTIDYIESSFDLKARQTASKYLRELVEAGLLEEEKIGKSKVFFSRPFLNLLS
ncbi:Fic family protein [Candidatus Peregrinibacteria bacterium]|nr:Fic family protein [Candidatus Peregrinibacteria bacterium]